MIRRDVWWIDGDGGGSSCQIPCFQQALKWGMAMICGIRRQGEAHYAVWRETLHLPAAHDVRRGDRNLQEGHASNPCRTGLQFVFRAPPTLRFSPFMTPQFSASSTSAQLLKDVDEQHREFKLTSRTHARQIISVKCSATIRPPDPLLDNNKRGGAL